MPILSICMNEGRLGRYHNFVGEVYEQNNTVGAYVDDGGRKFDIN